MRPRPGLVATCGLWFVAREPIPINPEMPTSQQITSLVLLREYFMPLVAEQGNSRGEIRVGGIVGSNSGFGHGSRQASWHGKA